MKLKKREIAIISILAIVIVVAGTVLFLKIREYSEGEKTYKGFEKYVFLTEELPTAEPDNGTAAGGSAATVPPQGEDKAKENVIDEGAPTVNFTALRELNPDIVGWIYSGGTPINYPVVQGDSNETYLYRMADGSGNKCGSIFLDSMNDRKFQDANNVVHGHNMGNGSMFAELTKYTKQEYYDRHQKIWLITPDETYSIEIFAGFVTTVDSDVWKLTFSTGEEFEAWKEEMAKQSCFASNIVPAKDEKVVTLSTCTYEFDNAHFVVLGVMR